MASIYINTCTDIHSIKLLIYTQKDVQIKLLNINYYKVYITRIIRKNMERFTTYFRIDNFTKCNNDKINFKIKIYIYWIYLYL